jgi:DNA (cytosine-5)-methyltransferase 1
VIAPIIVKSNHGDKPHYPVTEPTRTIVAGGTITRWCARSLHPAISKRRVRSRACAVSRSPRPPSRRAATPGMLVAPMLSRQFGASVGGSVEEPAPTVMPNGGGKFLAQHNTDMVGHDARKPVSTIVQKGCTQAVVSAGLVNLKGSERRGGSVEQPAPTQTAGGWHIAEVQAFLLKYYGADQDPHSRSRCTPRPPRTASGCAP